MDHFQTLVGAWTNSSRPFRLRSAAAALGIVGIALALWWCWPRTVALFATPLESEQLSQVDAQLAAWNVPHLSTVDNIEVDNSARNTLLLRLSLAGLPHEHIATSAETLAKASALTPDALLEEQSRTGLAGDIALALRRMDGISEANVVIAPARQGTFTDEDSSAASASVRLALRPGVVLSAAAIAGIRSFVSSAVPFLAPQRVVLVDDHGVALDAHQEPSDEAESTRAALQTAFDSAFGAGTTIVRVHALYEAHTELAHDIERLPVGGSALALQQHDEHLNSREKQYSEHEASEDHGSIVRDRQTTITAGELAHLSVAVLVDANRSIDLDKVRTLALAATGISAQQRELVQVEAVPFLQPPPPSGAGSRVFWSILWWLAPLGMLLALLVWSWRRLSPGLGRALQRYREQARIRVTTAATSGIAPREVLGLLAGEPAHTAAAVISALPTVTAAAVLDLYPSEERGAIVARMTRPVSVFVPTWEQLLHEQ